MTPARLLMACAVVLLAATAAACSGPVDPTVPYPDAEQRILDLYASGDVDGALEAVADGSVPDEISDDLRASLENVLVKEPPEVRDTVTHDVDGSKVVEVDTADGIRWCVRPDGKILLQCRVGIAQVRVDEGELPIEIVRAEVDVFPDERQLRIQIRPVGNAYTFDGLIGLFEEDGDPAPLLQTQAAVASQGEIVSDAGRDATVLPGTTMLLAWVTDVGASLDQQLELRWDGGSMPVTVQPYEYFTG